MLHTEVNLKIAKTITALRCSWWVGALKGVTVHWLCLNGHVWVPLSGLHLEQALELEGHHLPVVTRANREGHPVAGGFGQHTR